MPGAAVAGLGPCRSKDKSPHQRAATSGRSALRARGAVLPKHVRACAHQNGRYGARWFIQTWKSDNPGGSKVRVPYLCQSWRCEGCRKHESQVLYTRIVDALDGVPAHECVFMVLTLDRNGTLNGAGWKDTDTAFGALSGLTERLLKRMRRMHTENGWACFKSAWVGTVEAHGSGWPHLNLIIHSPAWAAELEREQAPFGAFRPVKRGTRTIQLRGGCYGPQLYAQLRGAVRHHVIGAGWGGVGTAEPGRCSVALASYIVKLVGELAKKSQLPIGAPARMRRLRSGKGFLPPRNAGTEGVTGTLVRQEIQPDGSWDVTSVQSCPEAMREPVVMAECHIIRAEEDRRSRGVPWEATRVLAWVFPGDAGKWPARTET